MSTTVEILFGMMVLLNFGYGAWQHDLTYIQFSFVWFMVAVICSMIGDIKA